MTLIDCLVNIYFLEYYYGILSTQTSYELKSNPIRELNRNGFKYSQNIPFQNINRQVKATFRGHIVVVLI